MYLNTLTIAGLAVLMLGTAFVFADIDFDSKFGSLGTGTEELDNPTDVIVSSDGNTIYVVDSENHRINVFEDDGDHDFLFGSFCSIFSIQSCNDNANGANELGDGQFDTPIGIATDQSGNYYVVDSENYRIQKFDDDGQYQLKFGSSDSGASDYLAAPRGIAVLDDTGEIFVSSMTEDSIIVFDSLGDFAYSFDSFDNDNFNNPRYVLIEDNMLYVADSGNDQIVIFQLVTISSCPSNTEEIVDGVCFVEKFGTTGSDDGEFNSPRGLAFDSQNDLLYVVDTGNDRIQSFNLVDDSCPSDTEEIVDGVCFVEKFGTTGSDDGEFNSPRGLAFDSQNDLLYVADTGNDRIQILSVGIDQLSLLPGSPTDIRAFPLSPTSLMIAWNTPEVSEGSEIIGYKIEYRVGSDSYQIITDNTKSTATNFVHNGLDADTAYTYRVSAINSEGVGSYSSSVTEKPESTDTPSGLLANAISPSQVKLTWHPPSNTFGQSISSYEIHRVLSTGVYDSIDTVDSDKTTYVVTGLTTDKTYSFAVSAHLGFSATDKSNTASATPRSDSVDNSQPPGSSTVVSKTVPAPPKLFETVESSSQVKLTWTISDDGNSPITGYKIESKKGSGNFVTLVADTKSTAKSYKHTGLVTGTNYSYRVFAINSEGISDASNIVTATPESVLKLSPIGKLSVNEGNMLSFAVKITDPSIGDVSYSLDPNAPSGAIINSKSGLFSWTPDSSQGAKTYTFGIVAKTLSMTDTQSVSITVNDVLNSEPKATEPKDDDDKKTDELEIPAPFVDDDKDPKYYVDRYLNEQNYKAWFDDNYPEYDSIYQAVGLNEPPSVPAPFVDDKHDPRYYVVRYTYEPDYKAWFDDNYPEYDSIYQAVGLPEKKLTNYGYCGEGTKLIDGVCTIIRQSQ